MTFFEIFANFVLSYFNSNICPVSDKQESENVEFGVLTLMRNLANQSSSCRLMAGGHQEHVFLKGIKDRKQMPRIHVRDVKEKSSTAAYSD